MRYTVGNSLTSLITSHFVGLRAALCSLRHSNLSSNCQVQKCIRMGITIFKIFLWGGISSNIRSEIIGELSRPRRACVLDHDYQNLDLLSPNILSIYKLWINILVNIGVKTYICFQMLLLCTCIYCKILYVHVCSWTSVFQDWSIF